MEKCRNRNHPKHLRDKSLIMKTRDDFFEGLWQMFLPDIVYSMRYI
jgi:hypothetical protein